MRGRRGGDGLNILQSSVHNVVEIRELRHANVDKQRKLLVGVDVTTPRGAA